MNTMNQVLQYDSVRIMATYFIESKGRLPVSRDEFLRWLMEFDRHLQDMLKATQDAYREHLELCNHPVLIALPTPKP